ncbi:MAG: hypothetical protein ACRED3_15580 [Bradyrhizobium sp.]
MAHRQMVEELRGNWLLLGMSRFAGGWEYCNFSFERQPLFALMSARGYDWASCNVADAPTERVEEPAGAKVLGKIDWFFSRGLRASLPAVVPALRADGRPSSDHDCLIVRIELEPRASRRGP